MVVRLLLVNLSELSRSAKAVLICTDSEIGSVVVSVDFGQLQLHDEVEDVVCVPDFFWSSALLDPVANIDQGLVPEVKLASLFDLLHPKLHYI